MDLLTAKNIAIEVWNKLKPHCDICKIAGSIRREKPEPNDIEIVCLPKTVVLKNMFEEEVGKLREPLFSMTVATLGKVFKGNAVGKMMQIHLAGKDIDLDLFMPDDFDYWRQFAIRTGSADWTTKRIAGGWKKIGWCGSDAGLRLQSQCEGTKGPDGKTKWKCIVPIAEQTLPPHWKSEEEFFNWLGLKWIQPKLRNI